MHNGTQNKQANQTTSDLHCIQMCFLDSRSRHWSLILLHGWGSKAAVTQSINFEKVTYKKVI